MKPIQQYASKQRVILEVSKAFRLTKEEDTQLKDLAASLGISVSDFIRALIKQYIDLQNEVEDSLEPHHEEVQEPDNHQPN